MPIKTEATGEAKQQAVKKAIEITNEAIRVAELLAKKYMSKQKIDYEQRIKELIDKYRKQIKKFNSEMVQAKSNSESKYVASKIILTQTFIVELTKLNTPTIRDEKDDLL